MSKYLIQTAIIVEIDDDELASLVATVDRAVNEGIQKAIRAHPEVTQEDVDSILQSFGVSVSPQREVTVE